jgi:prephenate dehydratase
MANHEQYIKRPIISIQGIEGSYHDKAAQHYFGADYRPIMCDTFEEVFDTVANGDAHYGMSAVENFLYGPIGAVHDLLADASDIAITGEITLGIHHSLIGQQGATLADITDVHSHPVALAQCKDYIVRTLNGAKAHEESDTAASVPIVKALGRVTAAALASPDVAAKYGMMIFRYKC